MGKGATASVAVSPACHLYVPVGPAKVPVVYCPDYNIDLWGLEKLHPFDCTKYSRVVGLLEAASYLRHDQVVAPGPATEEDLLQVHSPEYLRSLTSSFRVAQILEAPLAAVIPNSFLQQRVLKPFRYQVGGSVLAARLALERGWAVNVGGGFHHASRHQGGGFCFYADISLVMHCLRRDAGIRKIMIIDLDAHQGNGDERDALESTPRGDTFILDVYNVDEYPKDIAAKEAIDIKVELPKFTGTEVYLEKLSSCLQAAFASFSPELVIYNAGTDIIVGDPEGHLSVSVEGVMQRDEMVFKKCVDEKIPVVMLLSGGYQKNNAEVIATSLGNLADKGLITFNHSTK